ncbi:MAG TPA: ADYC domain-containing protein [Kofleriaceae bacterium]|nr:ADYC domain-containing protein [Kofleriaceae bacterium]
MVSLPPNGISLTGINLFSLPPNGVSLNGLDPSGLGSNGQPIGISVSGPPLTGAGMAGSTWTGRLSNGGTVALRLDAAVQGTGSNADVWSYRISASVDGAWKPLCLDHAGNPSFADSVPGTWNVGQGVPGGGSYHPESSQFSIACKGSSISKCVELGYKPWAGRDPEMAACVRAMRADYCGDGTPYTVDGTIINIFDEAGIVADAVAWVPEAVWTPDGAACVSKKKNTRFDQVAHTMPTCYPHAVKPEKSCGTEFVGAEVIITELAPQ